MSIDGARTAAAGADAPPSPPARRLQPPSWLDLRLVLGILLVLVAVVLGARVLAGADRSTTVWGLAHDVTAGTTLEDGDLRRVRIKLLDDAAQYLSTTTSPAGLRTTRDLRAGELLPRPALHKVPPGVLVPVPVAPAQLPPALMHGDRIDIWAGPKNATGAQPAGPELILRDVAVQSVDSSRSRLSSTTDVQLTVRVDPADEQRLVTAVAASTIYIVQNVGSTAGPGS